MNDESTHFDFYRKLKSEYDEIWKNYADGVKDFSPIIQGRKHARKGYYDLINACIRMQPAALILEVGCGTGIDLNMVANENRNSRLYGCDISFGSISTTLKVNDFFKCPICTFTADAQILPIKDDSFDIIYSQGLIEHFIKPVDLIREQLRVLKKGGILIINVPQKYTGYSWMKKKLIKKGEWKLGWETSFSYRDLKKIGKILNLQEVQVAGYQYWKSWKEPAFILKDLYDKFDRRNPYKELFLFSATKKTYDAFWKWLENKWGHYFLQNIVIAFQKPR